ncbi:MAG: class I SAM-dependent methyltransferase [Halolamina sp.]
MDEQKRAVRDGYDEMADRYEAERADDTEHDGLAQLRAGLPPEPRLLDLGCGAGAGPLQQFDDSNAVGLDFSGEQLRLAQDRTDAGLVAGDMAALPFTDEQFDAVTAFYSVIHLPVEQHGDCYTEVARVLRPGGRFLFSIGDDWAGANDDWLDSGTRMEWSFPSMADTERLVEDAGLTVEERFSVRSKMDDADWPFVLCRKEP